MSYDPQIHHRRSTRLKGYDYTQPGAYFVTLVTYRREEIFGKIIQGEMQLSVLGQIVHDEWVRSAEIRKEIRLNADELAIMPNHAHGIVWIVNHVGADGVRPDFDVHLNVGDIPNKGARRVPLQRLPGSLGSFIAGFKSSVTSRAKKELGLTGVWQRNYYEHIIRNEAEFHVLWNYMDDNPRKWDEDQLHPSAPPNPFSQA
jgi:REP element-mobilizing transposase RayT